MVEVVNPPCMVFPELLPCRPYSLAHRYNRHNRHISDHLSRLAGSTALVFVIKLAQPVDSSVYTMNSWVNGCSKSFGIELVECSQLVGACGEFIFKPVNYSTVRDAQTRWKCDFEFLLSSCLILVLMKWQLHRTRRVADSAALFKVKTCHCMRDQVNLLPSSAAAVFGNWSSHFIAWQRARDAFHSLMLT
jgi:hypothetical protein